MRFGKLGGMWFGRKRGEGDWDEAMRRIIECRDRKLKKLDLSKLDLETIPDQLRRFTWLHELDLSENLGLENAALEVAAENCPNLKSLNLSNCWRLTDRAMRTVARHCSELLSLNVKQCLKLTDSTVWAIAHCCPDLVQLDLGDCDEITDEAILAIARNCPDLRSLAIGFCKEVTDESIVMLAEECHHLRFLDAEFCKSFTDVAVLALAENCPHLESLNLLACGMITDKAIQGLARGCPDLELLDVRACDRLTDAAVYALAEYSRSLTSLNLWECYQITSASVLALAKGVTGPSLRSLQVERNLVRGVPGKAVKGHDAQAIFEYVLQQEGPQHVGRRPALPMPKAVRRPLRSLRRRRSKATETQRFTVALSFPGEKRAYVEAVDAELCTILEPDKVFYDNRFKHELAQPDLHVYLQQIYHDDSELLVVFLCAEYEAKEWCYLEWRAISDLIKQRRGIDVMLFRFDNAKIPGSFSTDGYIDANRHTPEEAAELIHKRLLFNRERRGGTL